MEVADGFETATCGIPHAGGTWHCIMQTNNGSETRNLRVMGSFRKRKKKPSTELNIFLSKIFSTENNKILAET